MNKITLVGTLMSCLFCFLSCGDSKDTDESIEEINAKTDPLRPKVESVCGSCHKFVEPEVLDKKTWDNLLPFMGPRLGIFNHNGREYFSDFGNPYLQGFFPEKPMLTKEEWQSILDYFQTYAPETIAPQHRDVFYSKGLDLFSSSEIKSSKPAVVSLSYVTKNNSFFSYNASEQSLTLRDAFNQVLAEGKFKNPVSYIQPYQNGYLITEIGHIFPSDEWLGTLKYIEIQGKKIIEKKTFNTKLERPVQFKLGDLDGDGKDDVVMCGFGNNRGSFYWLKNTGNAFVRKPLTEVPGAINTMVLDFDKDGDLDIVTLFAQALEKIVWYKNDGKGNFTEKTLLSFSPVQGSSSFDLVDMDKDGNLDIIYTCGDNADYSVALKKYHGVYIYSGDGKGGFKETYFYAMNGAYKAIARDYDGDGDKDIAAIAFFADFNNQPDEGFLFFEQKGKMDFKVSTHTDTYKGRWLTMDAGDIDNDGDIDLVLGNFSQGPSSVSMKVLEQWSSGPAVMVLKNTTK